MKRRLLGSVLFVVAALLPGAVPAQEAGTGADWPTYTGTLEGQRYSSLDQINPGNVKQIQPVSLFQTGVASTATSFENTPLVVDGRMYVSTAMNVIYAMKADTGELLWFYDPKIKTSFLQTGHLVPRLPD